MNQTAYYPSIFNDVIGPVMRGPSSSHTAAAHRIGAMVRQMVPRPWSRVVVKFHRTGSLPTTYLGQGSAMGLAGGFLGIDMKNPAIINYRAQLKKNGLAIKYEVCDLEDKHPNGYDITVERPDREDVNLFAVSTGGGMFEITRFGGSRVSLKGDRSEEIMVPGHPGSAGAWLEIKPVLPVQSAFDIALPFTTVGEMLDSAEKENLSLSDLAFRYECARSGLGEPEILKKMEEIVRVVRDSIREGLAGTEHSDRILGPQSMRIENAEKEGRIAPSVVNSVIAYTSALMEVKSALGLIVAAPTAGSCGVLGGALIGSLGITDFEIEPMARGFLAAGMAGIFIADRYTFSAEEGGCQVETGSAAAMAAAGLVDLNGGTAPQSIAAASMALQNQLGQICDPVAVRVEVPCLGKNILAASNAYNSYVMAISGFDPVIPYEEVIDAMKKVGEALPSSLCCTGLGGLAQTPTGKRLHEQYNED